MECIPPAKIGHCTTLTQGQRNLSLDVTRCAVVTVAAGRANWRRNTQSDGFFPVRACS
jgi:hypothetical protein